MGVQAPWSRHLPMAGETGIFIRRLTAGEARQELVLRRANRHGLIAGATGTGKTVTMQGWPRASRRPASRCSSPT
jgi:Cdc6-like AAA superfamily ATPase